MLIVMSIPAIHFSYKLEHFISSSYEGNMEKSDSQSNFNCDVTSFLQVTLQLKRTTANTDRSVTNNEESMILSRLSLRR